MDTKMEQLVQLVGVPVPPLHSGTENDWLTVEKIVGFVLPDDYKSIVNIYGPGIFDNFLTIHSPFAPFCSNFNLLSGSTNQILRSFRAGKDEFPQYSPPFNVYPDLHGLFPWGTTVNGDTLFWLPQGDPSEWPCVICDSKFSEDYDIYHVGVLEFLLEWLNGRIDSSVLPPKTA